MKKVYFVGIFAIIILTLLLVLTSCQGDAKTSTTENTDTHGDIYHPTMNSLKEYEAYLEKRKFPDDFVHYEDISMLGEFVCCVFYSETEYYYCLQDGSAEVGFLVTSHSKNTESTREILEAPLDQKHMLNVKGSGVVRIGSLYYGYICDQLTSISWQDENHFYQLTSTVHFTNHSSGSDKTVIDRLILVDKTHEAFTEINQAITSSSKTDQ